MKTKTPVTMAIAMAMAFVLSSCATGIKLTEQGEKVRLLDPGEVASCRKLGNSNTSVTWQIAGIARPEETISRELQVIARNSASRMGGDTIVPLTVIDKGVQTFVVYKCVNPDG